MELIHLDGRSSGYSPGFTSAGSDGGGYCRNTIFYIISIFNFPSFLVL